MQYSTTVNLVTATLYLLVIHCCHVQVYLATAIIIIKITNTLGIAILYPLLLSCALQPLPKPATFHWTCFGL